VNYISHLPPGSRFTLPGLHVAGIVLKVCDGSTRVRLDRPATVVEISDPDGRPRTFVARRDKETSWANTTLVERLPNEPDDQLESDDETMTTKTKAASKAKKTPKAKAPKAPKAAKVKTAQAKTPKAARVPKTKAADGEKASKAPSLLDCAVIVLTKSGKPMTTGQMVEEILLDKLWSSTGKTPAATLYSGILREIEAKGDESRFKKVDRGQFELR
jgi:hypothetical protein